MTEGVLRITVCLGRPHQSKNPDSSPPSSLCPIRPCLRPPIRDSVGSHQGPGPCRTLEPTHDRSTAGGSPNLMTDNAQPLYSRGGLRAPQWGLTKLAESTVRGP